MKIILDENRYIVGYASIGDIIGGIESDLTNLDLAVPFLSAYQLIDGIMIRDDAKFNQMQSGYIDPAVKFEQDQAIKADQELRLERQITAMINATRSLIRADELSAEDLAGMIDLYDPWIPSGHEYKLDDKVTYKGKLWKVIATLPHISQPDWAPDVAFSLFMQVQPAGVIEQFVQPFGGSGTYVLGAKVIFEGKVYENIYTAQPLNLWSPIGLPSGWKLIP